MTMPQELNHELDIAREEHLSEKISLSENELISLNVFIEDHYVVSDSLTLDIVFHIFVADRGQAIEDGFSALYDEELDGDSEIDADDDRYKFIIEETDRWLEETAKEKLTQLGIPEEAQKYLGIKETNYGTMVGIECSFMVVPNEVHSYADDEIILPIVRTDNMSITAPLSYALRIGRDRLNPSNADVDDQLYLNKFGDYCAYIFPETMHWLLEHGFETLCEINDDEVIYTYYFYRDELIGFADIYNREMPADLVAFTHELQPIFVQNSE